MVWSWALEEHCRVATEPKTSTSKQVESYRFYENYTFAPETSFKVIQIP